MSKNFDLNGITTKYLKFYKNGFTLIELLVVISIIGVLSAIGMASFGIVSQNGRDAKRLADLRIIQGALEQYYADQGYYPMDDDMNLLLRDGSSFKSPGADPNNVKTYYNRLPKDPSSPTSSYVYKAFELVNNVYAACSEKSKCVTYCIYAAMENSSNTSNESNRYNSQPCIGYTGKDFALTPP